MEKWLQKIFTFAPVGGMVIFWPLAGDHRAMEPADRRGPEHKLIPMPIRNKSADPLGRAHRTLATPVGASLIKSNESDLIDLFQSCDLPLGRKNRRQGQRKSDEKNKNSDASDGDPTAAKSHFFFNYEKIFLIKKKFQISFKNS